MTSPLAVMRSAPDDDALDQPFRHDVGRHVVRNERRRNAFLQKLPRRQRGPPAKTAASRARTRAVGARRVRRPDDAQRGAVVDGGQGAGVAMVQHARRAPAAARRGARWPGRCAGLRRRFGAPLPRAAGQRGRSPARSACRPAPAPARNTSSTRSTAQNKLTAVGRACFMCAPTLLHLRGKTVRHHRQSVRPAPGRPRPCRTPRPRRWRALPALPCSRMAAAVSSAVRQITVSKLSGNLRWSIK